MKLSGIAVSLGLTLGHVLKVTERELQINHSLIEDADVESEVNRFWHAQKYCVSELRILKEKTERTLGRDQAEIFEGHILLATDPEMEEEVIHLIRNEKYNAAHAVQVTLDAAISSLKTLKEVYLRERASDFFDIRQRLLKNILEITLVDLSALTQPVILVADDLTPSLLAQANPDKILGIATTFGGRTSHTSIMAQTLDIPMIIRIEDLTSKVKDGDTLILNALSNTLIINPDAAQIHAFEIEKTHDQQERQEYAKLKELRAETADGFSVQLKANIGTPKDASHALQQGAEGIGLFRSEFLFMDTPALPSEDTQYAAYKSVLEKMQNKGVIIRTMDVGGDKDVPGLNQPEETNPFLGWRAIRIFFDRPDIMVTQLRALLRASAHGKLAIMFPMIIGLEEFRELKKIVTHIKQDFTAQNIAFDSGIALGIMMETPAAAVMANELAKEVDFFSIGTNDLTQYTLAVDRSNEKIARLYDALTPPVLRLIKQIIDAGHQHGTRVGMCGELAGDLRAIPLLLGLGLDEFSMMAANIPRVKHLVRSIARKDAENLANAALNCLENQEIHALLDEFHQNINLEFN